MHENYLRNITLIKSYIQQWQHWTLIPQIGLNDNCAGTTARSHQSRGRAWPVVAVAAACQQTYITYNLDLSRANSNAAWKLAVTVFQLNPHVTEMYKYYIINWSQQNTLLLILFSTSVSTYARSVYSVLLGKYLVDSFALRHCLLYYISNYLIVVVKC